MYDYGGVKISSKPVAHLLGVHHLSIVVILIAACLAGPYSLYHPYARASLVIAAPTLAIAHINCGIFFSSGYGGESPHLLMYTSHCLILTAIVIAGSPLPGAAPASQN